MISCNSANEEDIYKKINHKLLHTSEVYESIEYMVGHIADKTDLDEDLVLLLLHENRWD